MTASTDGVDVLAKLLKLAEHLDELSEDDRQFVVQMLEYHGERKLLLAQDVPRLVEMQVPGEASLLDSLLQDGTVSVERKYLDEVIWRFMPLEVLFSLLSTKTLHFSPLSCMRDRDPNEGELPPSAFERTKAQLLKNSIAGITADAVVTSLTKHRKETVSISCWYMADIDNREMWRDYAPNNGVAIRTTVQRLFSSLRKINDTNIHLGQVTYFESNEEAQYADQAFFGSLYIKNAEPYRKERELRAVAPNGRDKYGVDIPVSLAVLIERLVLSPELRGWTMPFVIEAIQHFGLKCPIEKSSIVV